MLGAAGLFRGNMLWLAPILALAAAFADPERGRGRRFLRVMAGYVERAAKRLFGIPDFKYYALADGLRSLFMRHPGPPSTRIRGPGQAQLLLFAVKGS